MNPSDHFLQLTEYIQQQLKEGISEADIRRMLHQHNWQADWVDSAFATLKAPVPLTPLTPSLEQPRPVQQQAAPQAQSLPVNTAQKYKVFKAIGDTLEAIQRNTMAFVVAIIISSVVTTAGVVVALLFMVGFGAAASQFNSIAAMAVVAVLVILISIVWSVLTGALTQILASLTVRDGLEGRQSVISQLLSEARSKLVRIMGATALYMVIIGVPYILFMVALLLMGAAGSGNKIISILGILGGFVGVAWLIIAVLRYALAPVVALFEPELPLTKTLGRSRHLLKSGGQWFLFKGFLVYLLSLLFIGLPFALVTGGLAVGLVQTVLTAFANAVLVLLYLNRKAVRG